MHLSAHCWYTCQCHMLSAYSKAPVIQHPTVRRRPEPLQLPRTQRNLWSCYPKNILLPLFPALHWVAPVRGCFSSHPAPPPSVWVCLQLTWYLASLPGGRRSRRCMGDLAELKAVATTSGRVLSTQLFAPHALHGPCVATAIFPVFSLWD